MLFLKLKKEREMSEGTIAVEFGKEGGSSYWEGAQEGFWAPKMFYFVSQGNSFTRVCSGLFHQAVRVRLFSLF